MTTPPADDGDGPGPMAAGPAVKGILIVAGAVVLGALLLPSATGPGTTTAGTTPVVTTSTTTTTRPGSTTTTSAPAPSTFKVVVANGTTVPKAAGNISTFLGSKGYSTLAATDATNLKETTSFVFLAAGTSPAAGLEVAAVLGLPATDLQTTGTPPVSSANAVGANVIVIAGADLANRFAGTTTSTTVG